MIKKFINLSLAGSSILLPLTFVATSCKHNDNEDEVHYDILNITKCKSKKIKSSEFEEIKKTIDFSMDKLMSEFQLKDGITGNSVSEYWITKHSFKKNQVQVDKYVLTLDSVSNNHQFDKTQRITSSTNHFKNEKTFKLTVANKETNELYFSDYAARTISYIAEQDITLPIPEDVISTNLDMNDLVTINVDWNQVNYYDGIIDDFADGDTVYTKITNNPKNIKSVEGNAYKAGDRVKIRVHSIDTPEKAVGQQKACEFEQQFAKLSSKFVTDNFKKGKPLRFIYSGKDGYGRDVCSIFFNKDLTTDGNYDHSYSVEIVRRGLSLPYTMEGRADVAKFNNPREIPHYTYKAIAKGLKEAKDKKLGFFKIFATPDIISDEVYIIKKNQGYIYFDETNDKYYFKGQTI